MDDLLVFSKTEEQDIGHLRDVFHLIRQFGLNLSERGVKPEFREVYAIQRMAMPRDISERDSETIKYHKLLSPFCPRDGRATVLAFPDITKPFTITTDARMRYACSSAVAGRCWRGKACGVCKQTPNRRRN